MFCKIIVHKQNQYLFVIENKDGVTLATITTPYPDGSLASVTITLANMEAANKLLNDQPFMRDLCDNFVSVLAAQEPQVQEVEPYEIEINCNIGGQKGDTPNV